MKDKQEEAHAIYHERIGIICEGERPTLEAKKIAWEQVQQQIEDDPTDKFFWHKIKTFIRNN